MAGRAGFEQCADDSGAERASSSGDDDVAVLEGHDGLLKIAVV
jgi:hypothetical protein